MIFATSPQVDTLQNQPFWAVALALAILLFIFWCVVQWHLDRIENPPESDMQLLIVSIDYSTATEWCYRNGINPRWPYVHIVTKPHHAQGFCLTERDLIVDLYGSKPVVDLARSCSPRTPVQRV